MTAVLTLDSFFDFLSSCVTHAETSINLSKSIPVSIPNECNIYTTSSVGTFPVAPAKPKIQNTKKQKETEKVEYPCTNEKKQKNMKQTRIKARKTKQQTFCVRTTSKSSHTAIKRRHTKRQRR